MIKNNNLRNKEIVIRGVKFRNLIGETYAIYRYNKRGIEMVGCGFTLEDAIDNYIEEFDSEILNVEYASISNDEDGIFDWMSNLTYNDILDIIKKRNDDSVYILVDWEKGTELNSPKLNA